MFWVLMLLLTILVALLVRNSGTASIEIPKSIAISNYTNQNSRINTTEDDYSKVMVVESNQTTSDNNGGLLSIFNDHSPNLDFIMPTPPTNETCIRRDYNEDVAAVFKEKVGPIDTAFVVFNTTFSSFKKGRIHNTTELIGLTMVNETTVDCDDYPMYTTKRLNIHTRHSLLGGYK